MHVLTQLGGLDSLSTNLVDVQEIIDPLIDQIRMASDSVVEYAGYSVTYSPTRFITHSLTQTIHILCVTRDILICNNSHFCDGNLPLLQVLLHSYYITQLLTHSLTHSLTYLLTYSLTH